MSERLSPSQSKAAWFETQERRDFIGALSGADYEALMLYLNKHKIPPRILPLQKLKRILEDIKKGVKDD